MFYIVCQSYTWRIYKEGESIPLFVGIGEIETALAIARLNDIIVSEFYNLQTLRAG